MKIPNREKLQQIAINHSPDIDIKEFTKIYKKFTANVYYSSSDNTLRSWNILMEKNMESNQDVWWKKKIWKVSISIS